MAYGNITAGVIISTYNNPKWLEKTLWGYAYQTRSADEIIIADDGSTDDTRQLIENFRTILPIRHVWHEDNGFRKSRILNSALVNATADYLIFTDQDCIPRADFIETHLKYASENHFLSGGYFRLPMDISLSITREDIKSRDAFRLPWLRKKGLRFTFKCTKLFNCKNFACLMNAVTPAHATWNGCNASGWRTDLLATNGFNEEMHYGGQDREFGERLVNMGLRPIQIRYSAIALHLDHRRPYKTKESMEKNIRIRKETRRSGIIETPHGIKQLHDKGTCGDKCHDLQSTSENTANDAQGIF